MVTLGAQYRHTVPYCISLGNRFPLAAAVPLILYTQGVQAGQKGAVTNAHTEPVFQCHSQGEVAGNLCRPCPTPAHTGPPRASCPGQCPGGF